MSISQFCGLILVANVALAVVWMIVAPSWGGCFAAIGWTTAWYFHYTTAVFIRGLIEDGIIEMVEDE